MIKSNLMLIVCLFSLSSFANTIPENKLEDYKQAISLLLKSKYLFCDDHSGEKILNTTIAAANYGEINQFDKNYIILGRLENNKFNTIAYIFVSDDLKSIISFRLHQFTYENVYTNSGDLLNPVISSEYKWIENFSTLCEFR